MTAVKRSSCERRTRKPGSQPQPTRPEASMTTKQAKPLGTTSYSVGFWRCRRARSSGFRRSFSAHLASRPSR
ncbi:MAG: hypothetical protein OXG81_05635 [Acidobacteria bacterium]|nr:hypothetical protein [Acidobacteriota bacterium]